MLSITHKIASMSKTTTFLTKQLELSYSVLRKYRDKQDFQLQYKASLLAQNEVEISTHVDKFIKADTGNYSIVNHFGFETHDMDVFGQSIVASSLSWADKALSIKSVFDNSSRLTTKLNQRLIRDIDNGYFNTKDYVDKRLCTTQEIICANAGPSCLPLSRLDFNKSLLSIPKGYNNLSGQHRPDYIGCLVTLQGKYYVYYIDLKRTTVQNFESLITGKIPKKFINCNIYLLGDVNQNHVFSPVVKQGLENIANYVYKVNMSSGDSVAISVAQSSVPYFNYFRVHGDLNSYNKIPMNTVKFLTLDMLSNIYPG